MSLFGCKDDSLLWFIILFLLLFCTGCGNEKCSCENVSAGGSNNSCDYNSCNCCLR